MKNLPKSILLVLLFSLLISIGLYADGLDGSPVFTAIHNYDIPTLQALVRSNADLDVRNSRGYTPLLEAVSMQSVEMTAMLIDGGADVNARLECAACSEQTALMIAAYNNDPEIVQYLLENGADPDLQDSQGMTALMLAITGYYEAPGQYIFDHIDEPDIGESYDDSYYIRLILEDYFETIQYLVNKGADMSIENNNSQNAVELAEEKESENFGHEAGEQSLLQYLRENS